MATFSLIKPMDQPIGKRRLIEELKHSFADAQFKKFDCVVAFGQAGPIARLRELISSRRANGLKARALFGIDKRGTSFEALRMALDTFDEVFVTRGVKVTFHPKIYAFSGPSAARAFVGSNNFTVGGTETNFEAAARLDFKLPGEKAEFGQVEDAIAELLPAACPATRKLDASLLAKLVKDGVVPKEAELWATGETASPSTKGVPAPIKIKPPSPLPKKSASPAPAGATSVKQPTSDGAEVFAIQIKPHHNGEIFLSKTAALQNPEFFGWPFTGVTAPKRDGNPGYPQRLPDPKVRIVVWGAGKEPLLVLANYDLNTVYYETKSEIRITASPLVSVVPEYSVMVMRPSPTAGLDYEIDIHTPDSPAFADWLAACNQTMPSGGREPRKFGWF